MFAENEGDDVTEQEEEALLNECTCESSPNEEISIDIAEAMMVDAELSTPKTYCEAMESKDHEK